MGLSRLFRRDLCPALSGLQCLQTLVSGVTTDFLVVSGEWVNLLPATSFGESLHCGEHF